MRDLIGLIGKIIFQTCLAIVVLTLAAIICLGLVGLAMNCPILEVKIVIYIFSGALAILIISGFTILSKETFWE